MAWSIVALFPMILFLTGFMLVSYDTHKYDNHPYGKYRNQFGMNLSFLHLSDAQWNELKRFSKQYYFIAAGLSIVGTVIIVLVCGKNTELAMTLIIFLGMALELLTLAALVIKVRK